MPAGASIGPVNLMLRADASMVGADMDKALKQVSLKGSLQRINPALGAAGLGMDKGFIKQMMREAPGILGSNFGAVAGMLGSAAGILGPIGLGLAVAKMAGHAIYNHASEGARTAFDTSWENFTGSMVPKNSTDNLVTGAASRMDLFTATNKFRQDEKNAILFEKPANLFTTAIENFARSGRQVRQLLAPGQGELAEYKPAGPPSKWSMSSLDKLSDELTIAALEASGGGPMEGNSIGGWLSKIHEVLSSDDDDLAQRARDATKRGLQGFA